MHECNHDIGVCHHDDPTDDRPGVIHHHFPWNDCTDDCPAYHGASDDDVAGDFVLVRRVDLDNLRAWILNDATVDPTRHRGKTDDATVDPSRDRRETDDDVRVLRDAYIDAHAMYAVSDNRLRGINEPDPAELDTYFAARDALVDALRDTPSDRTV